MAVNAVAVVGLVRPPPPLDPQFARNHAPTRTTATGIRRITVTVPPRLRVSAIPGEADGTAVERADQRADDQPNDRTDPVVDELGRTRTGNGMDDDADDDPHDGADDSADRYAPSDTLHEVDRTDPTPFLASLVSRALARRGILDVWGPRLVMSAAVTAGSLSG